MTQWEQIKKEYRDITVPAEGPHQMMETIAEAKRKRNRNRLKNMTKYATVAAAVLLVVILVPGMLLFSGGFATTEDAAMESDFAPQNAGKNSGSSVKNDVKSDAAAPTPTAESMAPAIGMFQDSTAYSNGSSMKPETPEYGLNDETSSENRVREEITVDAADAETEQRIETEVIWADSRDAISKEILCQMALRMQSAGETYYIKGKEYPDGFEQISEEQEYYINEDGLLVFVFQAGTVAPKEQGIIEFIIPAQVFQP